MTPFILHKVNELTSGQSLRASIYPSIHPSIFLDLFDKELSSLFTSLIYFHLCSTFQLILYHISLLDIALIHNNARVGSQIARALAEHMRHPRGGCSSHKDENQASKPKAVRNIQSTILHTHSLSLSIVFLDAD